MPHSRTHMRPKGKPPASKPAPKPKRTPAAKSMSVAPIASQDLLSVRLGFLIHDVSRLRRNAFDRLMRPLSVTRSQWWVLAYLSRHDGMTQTELANLLDVGKVTLGGLIDRLEASGWVVRRSDSVDRRVRRIFLSPTTESLFQEMHAAEVKLGKEILKGIGPQKAAELADLLAQMKDNLMAIGASAGQPSENDPLADE